MNKVASSGEALKALRQKGGLTLAQVAKAAGVSESYLSHVENGKKTPTVGWVGIVAEAIAALIKKNKEELNIQVA